MSSQIFLSSASSSHNNNNITSANLSRLLHFNSYTESPSSSTMQFTNALLALFVCTASMAAVLPREADAEAKLQEIEFQKREVMERLLVCQSPINTALKRT
jgi:hypothetical protein